MKEWRIGEVSVLLVNAEGTIHAIPPLCPHMEEPLVHGLCDRTTLTCIKHLWQWDLTTGDPRGLAEIPLKKYQVQLDEDGTVKVLVERELRYDYER